MSRVLIRSSAAVELEELPPEARQCAITAIAALQPIGAPPLRLPTEAPSKTASAAMNEGSAGEKRSSADTTFPQGHELLAAGGPCKVSFAGGALLYTVDQTRSTVMIEKIRADLSLFGGPDGFLG